MSKAKGKQDKDGLSSSSANVTLAELSSLLDEHRKTISADFKSSFEALTNSGRLALVYNKPWERISSLEDNSNEVEDRLQQIENACSTLQQDNALLKSKLADLEGRSRRQNIRIIGLPESLEGS